MKDLQNKTKWHFFYIPRTITVESFKFIYMYFYYSLLNKINFFDQRLQVFFVS